jgi:hypothetical protein
LLSVRARMLWIGDFFRFRFRILIEHQTPRHSSAKEKTICESHVILRAPPEMSAE